VVDVMAELVVVVVAAVVVDVVVVVGVVVEVVLVAGVVVEVVDVAQLHDGFTLNVNSARTVPSPTQ